MGNHDRFSRPCRSTVKKMLTNPVYTGQIAWGKTTSISTIEDGHRVKKQIAGTPSITENAHPAIISADTFNRVQGMFRESRHAYPTNTNKNLINPLAGLVYCSHCGKAMQVRGHAKGNPKDRLLACLTHDCPTRGTYAHVILDTVLETMREWCVEYKNPVPETKQEDRPQAQAIRRQISTIEAQIEKAQELVELGVYTPSEYLKRKGALQERLQAAKDSLAEQAAVITPKTISEAIPAIERVLDAFPMAETVEQQNRLLKSVIARIEYTKTESATKSIDPASLMTLKIFPRANPNGK